MLYHEHMKYLKIFVLTLALLSCASTDSAIKTDNQKKTYSNSSNKAFLEEGVRVMNYAFPLEMNGIRMEKVSVINVYEGIKFPMVMLTDIGELEGEFFAAMMTNMSKGMAKEACKEADMKELFDRNLYVVYSMRDIDGSVDIDIKIDKSICEE